MDHRSTDGTGELAQSLVKNLPHGRVVRIEDRLNASVSRNRGVELANGSAVAFCDADDIIRPGWARHELVGGRLEYRSLNEGSEYRLPGGSTANSTCRRLATTWVLRLTTSSPRTTR